MGLFIKCTTGEFKELVGATKENTIIHEKDTLQSYSDINFYNLTYVTHATDGIMRTRTRTRTRTPREIGVNPERREAVEVSVTSLYLAQSTDLHNPIA